MYWLGPTLSLLGWYCWRRYGSCHCYGSQVIMTPLLLHHVTKLNFCADVYICICIVICWYIISHTIYIFANMLFFEIYSAHSWASHTPRCTRCYPSSALASASTTCSSSFRFSLSSEMWCFHHKYYSCVVLWHMMAIVSVWMWILIKHNLIGPFDQASVFSWQKYILYSMVKQWQRQNGTKGQVLKPVFSKSRASFHQESVHPSESSVHNLSQFNSQHHSTLRTCSVGPISPK